MKRIYLNTLLATAIGVTSGCASSDKPSFWANPLSRRSNESKESAEPAKSSVAALKNPFSKSHAEEELSPEFIAAQKTLKKHPEKTLIAWARYQEDIGEYAEARKMYRELQIAYPKNMEAHLGMARIELLTGRSAQAEQILTDLVKKNPGDAQVRLAVGRMYSHQERWDEAIGAFQQACEIEPENQNCRYELGVAFARAGEFDQALSHLTFSVGEPAAHYNIGYILHEEGQNADATEWFRNALQLHPDQQTAEKSRAMLTKLSPSGASDGFGDSMIARNTSPSRKAMPVSDQRVVTRRILNDDPSASDQNNSDDGAEELPVVSGSGNMAATLPYAEQYESEPATRPQDKSDATPFRTASYVEAPAVQESSAYSSAQRPVQSEPVQWQGPSGPPAKPQTNQWSAPKDPPMWKARK